MSNPFLLHGRWPRYFFLAARVAAAFPAASRRFLVAAAFLPASRRFLVKAAFFAASLRLAFISSGMETPFDQ